MIEKLSSSTRSRRLQRVAISLYMMVLVLNPDHRLRFFRKNKLLRGSFFALALRNTGSFVMPPGFFLFTAISSSK